MSAPYRGDPGLSGSPGACPRCPDTNLEPRSAGRVAVALCRSCRGIWIGESSYLDVFFAADEELVLLARADLAAPRSARSGAAACPACGVAMESQSGTTGATLDLCASHGFWLDAGELGLLIGEPEPVHERPTVVDRLARWLVRDP